MHNSAAQNVSGKVLFHGPSIFAHKNGLLGSCFIFNSQEGTVNICYSKLSVLPIFVVASWHKANVDLFCEKSSTIRIDAFSTGQFKYSYQHGDTG